MTTVTTLNLLNNLQHIELARDIKYAKVLNALSKSGLYNDPLHSYPRSIERDVVCCIS